jgi:hypothetical protein
MAAENAQPDYVRLGLLNATLGVRRGAPESEPVIPTARDFGQLLTAFQQAVYATYALEQGWDSVQRLRREDRERFALRIVGQEEHSFFILLAAGPVIDPMTVFTLVTTTITTLTSVAALAIAYRSLRLQELSSQENRARNLLRQSAASMAEISVRTNHVVDAHFGPLHFTLNLESSIALRRFNGDHPASQTLDTPQFEFSEERLDDAVVVSRTSEDRLLRLYSPKYHDVIRCSYGEGYHDPSEVIQEGANISARGLATREKGDPPTSPPLLFRIDEILNLAYRR